MMTNNGPLDAGRDPLSIGVLMPNCSYSCSISTYKPVPDDWTFESNVAIAQAAEQVGFDFLFPVAKWRGYGGPTNYLGTSLETMTWAAGLLAQTKRIHVFSTVHVPIFHPFVVAKMGGTLDHIGQGRWGLNVVSGWSEREFGQMHVPILPHGERYRRTADYIEVLKGLWTAEPGTFNHHSEWYDVTDGWVSPLPVRKPHPRTRASPQMRRRSWRASATGTSSACRRSRRRETRRRTSAPGLRNTAARSAARPIHSPSGARRSARLSKSGARLLDEMDREAAENWARGLFGNSGSFDRFTLEMFALGGGGLPFFGTAEQNDEGAGAHPEREADDRRAGERASQARDEDRGHRVLRDRSADEAPRRRRAYRQAIR